MPERALEITDGVLAALAYSHQQGIVHRDIKPANVMLTRSGEVKVMDFGIARAVADSGATMTQTSAVIGTAQYLSPEQARGEQVDARSDLYSTGCLLYELLTGRPPFVGDSPVSVAYQHVREEPVPPSQRRPGRAAATPTRSSSRRWPRTASSRYQTADEMRRDIAAAQAGRTVAPPVVPVDATQAMGRTDVAARHRDLPGGGRRPDDDRKGGRALGYALLGLAVIAVFVLAALFGRELFSGGGGETVRVPDVTGLTVQQARTSCRRSTSSWARSTEEEDEHGPRGQHHRPDARVGHRGRGGRHRST